MQQPAAAAEGSSPKQLSNKALLNDVRHRLQPIALLLSTGAATLEKK